MSAELCAIRGGELYAVRSLTDEEYARANDAAVAVNRFSDNQHYFRMVEKSYEEFKDAVSKYAEDFAKSGELTYFQIMEMTADMNRLLLNVLAIIVTFVDHSTAKVKRDFGEDSDQMKALEEAKSAAYDEVFAYRFLWRLRNYATHVSLPLKPDIHVRDIGADESTPRLSFYFDRDKLLDARRVWSREMKNEIRGLPEKIRVDPLLGEMMECLEELDLGMIYHIYGQQLVEGALYLRDLWSSRNYADGHPCIRESTSTNRVLILPTAEARMVSDTILENQPPSPEG